MYILFCHWHFYYLYQREEDRVKLLCTERGWEPILSALVQHKVKELKIFDYTTIQSLQCDQAPKDLNFIEYIQWYWQKRFYVRSHFSFSLISPVWRFRSVLMSGLKESLLFSALCSKLKDQNIVFSVQSYPLAFLQLLQREIIDPKISCLVIYVDDCGHILLGFFSSGKLCFVRSLQGTVSQERTFVIKNAVTDTLDYLRKRFSAHKVESIFIIDDVYDISTLQAAFSSAQFFLRSQLSEFLRSIFSERPLEQFVFGNTRTEGLLTASGKGTPSWVYYLGPYMRLIKYVLIALSSFSFLMTLCLLYAMWSLYEQKNSLILQKNHLEKTALPLDQQNFQHIRTLQKKMAIQERKFLQMLKECMALLQPKYILRSLILNQKSLCLGIQSLETEPDFDILMEKCQALFPRMRVVQVPDENHDILVIDIPFLFTNENSSQ